ncbi:hypothetical protein [Yersinia sp. 1652 StPb PI]|uniref:hypothetical protein n=1 Tax=Yersinia sp. 1652 StPb PI TaxID=3061649 RepID=UPI00355C54CE
MNNIEELVYSAMQSSLEGYAASVVDSIEFELKRELTTDEHQQVFVAVDRAITGIAAEKTEIHNLKMKLADAGCLLVEWKQRVETAEAALSAANEKLGKAVVEEMEYCEWPNIDHDDSYVNGWNDCVSKIKAAGFTAEGG